MSIIISMAKKSLKLNLAKRICLLVFGLIIAFAVNINFTSVNALDKSTLYLGGFAAGFTVTTKGCEVIGISEVVSENGLRSPAKDAGIKEHDIILSVGGKETNTFEDIDAVLSDYKKGSLFITIKRDGETLIKELIPIKDLTGKYKLGVYVRDKLTGIGTITYVDKSGTVMALGHPICGDDDKAIEIKSGELFACNIYGVEKGERGKAGELKGMFLSEAILGYIDNNLAVGIKGRLCSTFDKSKLNEIEVGEGHIGEASIVTTVQGLNAEEFSVSIVKAEKNAKDNRNFVIKITDKKLLDIAGGIVQGMSGSPIVQDGKIVGAITHVFLNDPTRGFGISIQNML